MTNLSTDDLDSYVAFVDCECNGDVNDPRVLKRFIPINLLYKTLVDESLDPFSDEYFKLQIDLYEEIAGKHLDQCSGELHPVNMPALLEAPNPLGNNNVDFISEHVRALSSMLSLSCLGVDAPVLDLGAGHGLSSEIYAFCGCQVHAIDIDPQLSELAIKRSVSRSLRVTRSVMNFDSLSSIENSTYRAAFFFQSLHHSLRPWNLIAELKPKLTNSGVIAFSGEPLQDQWWKHWGLRLDQESLYVARKYGWFESGWSRSFITECFKRNGLELVLFENGLRGGMIGISSRDTSHLRQIIDKAISLGFTPICEGDIDNSIGNYHSQIGRFAGNTLRPSIRTNSNHGAGFLCYGPYISLPKGRYTVSFILRRIDIVNRNLNSSSSVLFDIVSVAEGSQVTHYTRVVTLNSNEAIQFINVELKLTDAAFRLEARVNVPVGNDMWEMSPPVFERAAQKHMGIPP
jgi:2-polyprenyl-3-methyl-5-hydroxy-6-metoxy-1,4-benzoquinol methylase